MSLIIRFLSVKYTLKIVFKKISPNCKFAMTWILHAIMFLMENKSERTALTIDQKIQIIEYVLEKKQVSEPLITSLLLNMAVQYVLE